MWAGANRLNEPAGLSAGTTGVERHDERHPGLGPWTSASLNMDRENHKLIGNV